MIVKEMRWLIKASKSDENCNVLRQFKVKSGPEMCQNIRVCDKTDFFLYCYFHILNKK